MFKKKNLKSSLTSLARRLKRKLKRLAFKQEIGRPSFKMSYLKKALSSLKTSFMILLLSLPLGIIALYYSISFIVISEEEMCLEALKQSFEKNVICREQCQLNRIQNKTCLIENLKDNSVAEKKLLAYLQNEEEDIEFRKKLLEIMLVANRDYKNYLLTYFKSKDISFEIKMEIFKLLDWSNVVQHPMQYYLSILDSSADDEMRLLSVIKIGEHQNKSRDFSLSDLDIFKKIILQQKTNNNLRQHLVMLLGDYLSFFREESRELLQEISEAEYIQDNIARAFAADFLKLPLPEISQLEWDSYYNN